MKKLTALLALIAFSAATVMQAGESASNDKSKGSCCEKAKATAQAKSGCSDAGSCCDSAKATGAAVKSDQKGATLLVKRLSDSRAKS